MEVTVEDLPQGQRPPVQPSEPQTAAKPVMHLAIAERFNIDIPTQEEDKKLQEVWNHVSELSDTKEISDIMYQTMHLEQTLGAPKLGETRLDKLYRYVKLRRQERQIQEELSDVSISGGLR